MMTSELKQLVPLTGRAMARRLFHATRPAAATATTIPNTINAGDAAANARRQQHAQRQPAMPVPNLSDVHQWLSNARNQATALSRFPLLSLPINPPILPTDPTLTAYLERTNATYSHVADMQYALHRVTGDLDIRILVNHEPSSTGRFVVSTYNRRTNEHLEFSCQPTIQGSPKGRLIDAGVCDLVKLTDRNGMKRELLASELGKAEFLEFFSEIGMDGDFIRFVDLHEAEVVRQQMAEVEAVQMESSFTAKPFRYI
jgi:hypothetical protein